MCVIDAGSIGERLDAVIRREFEGCTHISGLRRLASGASQETWLFDAVGPKGSERLVLRRAPGGERQHEMAVGMEAEAALIALAAESGVVVPPLRYVLKREDGVGKGFITGFVAGETLGHRIVRDARFAGVRQHLAHDCGAMMARIHAMPKERLPSLRRASAAERTQELYRRYNAATRPRPVFALAFRWLHENMPPEPALSTLVHGDFRNGNLIVDERGLQAVLDWEIAHLGDPIEDLGWFCVNSWRFGQIDKPAGGFGSREQLCAGYRSAGGTVEPGRLRFWEVLGTLSWGVSCAAMVETFRNGTDDTVERAMIARRASETEIDLVTLLTEAS
ncbi:MAG: phosphotransferase family protein [Alphaproteobacteria bacterium]|nr:phosphotransferase family protein [Alphaproteobacteria bacterium]